MPMTDPIPFFQQDDADAVVCEGCGWAGEAGDLAITEVSLEHQCYHQACPACEAAVRVVAFPTHAEVRAARRRGDPRADDLGPMGA
jgi:hypothetical protein